MIVDLIADGLRDLGHVLGDRVHHLQMVFRKTKSLTDGLELIGTSRVLSACHRSGQVIRDDDSDVGILVDGVEQTRHTAVGKGRVADDSDSGPLTSVAGTLSHRDRSSHVDTRVDGLIRGQEAKGITADITKDTCIGILAQHLVEGGIDIAVTTALTQCWRTWGDILTRRIALAALDAEGTLQEVGIQLTSTRQLACQTALDHSIAWHHTTHLILDEGLTLLSNQHILAIVSHTTNELLGDGVLRDLQYGERTTIRIALHQVVEGNTTGNDAELVVWGIDILVVLAVDSHLLEDGLLTCHDDVTLLGEGGQQHPVRGLGIVVELVLRT